MVRRDIGIMIPMEPLFKNYQFRSEPRKINRKEDLPRRSELVKRFVTGLNRQIDLDYQEAMNRYRGQGPKPKKWPHQQARTVAIRLSHLDISQLEWFLGYCQEAKHFGKCFWYRLSTTNARNGEAGLPVSGYDGIRGNPKDTTEYARTAQSSKA